jgi:hypothetical protein
MTVVSCSNTETGADPDPGTGESTDPGATIAETLQLESPAFGSGDTIPAEYCGSSVTGGRNESIPLRWSNAPEGTASFAIAMIDTHPVADEWVHWAVAGIPADVTALGAGASGSEMPAGATELRSTFGEPGYGGPAPPPGSGEHEYVITVYALDVADVDFKEQPSAADIERALEGHVLSSASITGVLGR